MKLTFSYKYFEHCKVQPLDTEFNFPKILGKKGKTMPLVDKHQKLISINLYVTVKHNLKFHEILSLNFCVRASMKFDHTKTDGYFP